MLKGIVVVVGLLLLVGGYFIFFEEGDGLTGRTVGLFQKKSPSDNAQFPSEEAQSAHRALMVDILELYKVSGKDHVKQAELVNEIDQEIQSINEDQIQKKWDQMEGCLAKSCSDKDFLDLILAVDKEADPRDTCKII